MQQIDEILKARLRDMLDTCHMPDNRFADSIGCTRSQINNLKNGRTSFQRLGLGVACRIFPEIKRAILGGAAQSIVTVSNSTNSGQNIHIAPSQDLDAYRGRLCMALAGLGLGGDALARVMEAVRDTR